MISHRAPIFEYFGAQFGALLSPVVAVLVMLINLLAPVVEVLVILARLPAVDRALAGVRATSPVVHHTRRAADRGGAIKGYNSPSLFF